MYIGSPRLAQIFLQVWDTGLLHSPMLLCDRWSESVDRMVEGQEMSIVLHYVFTLQYYNYGGIVKRENGGNNFHG